MAGNSVLFGELAERQQWLFDMWRVQHERGALAEYEACGLLRSNDKKPIRIAQSKFSLRAAQRIREGLAVERGEDEIVKRLRMLEEENGEEGNVARRTGVAPMSTGPDRIAFRAGEEGDRK